MSARHLYTRREAEPDWGDTLNTIFSGGVILGFLAILAWLP